MLEKILAMYAMAMTYDVRSPTPHVVGPPGCGKSTMVEQAAELLGKRLHIMNVSRLSPLEIEGLQMPVDDNARLHMIPASFWTNLQEGDIVLFDEFLRGFPEVYNGLLDIFTSRRAGAFVLPKVFIIAASNSVTTYDPALEDRLLHITVPDIRNSRRAAEASATEIVTRIGLLPEMVGSMEMSNLITSVVKPMYNVLDSFKGRGQRGGPTLSDGASVRKLIGQALLRQVEVTELKELINANNRKAFSTAKYQYVVLLNGDLVSQALDGLEPKLQNLVGNDKLSILQANNINMNLQLIELHKQNKEEVTDDQPLDDDSDLFE
jgi:MoxR-like ATPase